MNNNIKFNLEQKIKIFYFIYLAYCIYCALKIGIHWDIFTHLESGKNKINYLFSFGLIDKESNTPYIFHKITPGLSFALTAFVTTLFPQKYEVEILHLANLFISIVGIFGFYKFLMIFFNNKKISNIIILILITYASFFGHMSVNPKDTVVATSYCWFLYLVFHYIKFQNGKSNNNILVGLGFFLALGTGIRLLFTAILTPIFIVLIAEIFFFKKFINKKFSFKLFFIDIFKVFLIFYTIILIFWTHAHDNIFLNPYKFFLQALNPLHSIGAPFGLLNGKIYEISAGVERFYIPINLFFKSPEYFLLLYVISFFIFLKFNNFFKLNIKKFNYKLLYLISIIILTILMFSISPYPLYDGMRLFLFLIPLLCIIPGLIIYFLIANNNIFISKIILILIIPLFFVYIFNFLSLTPYNYSYQNNLVLNPDKKFENDYLALSLNQLLKKSSFLNKNNTKIAICGVGIGQIKYYLKKYNYFKIRVVTQDEQPNFIIMNNRVNWSSNRNSLTTCYKSYEGEVVSQIKKGGIILSTIKRLN